MSHTWRRRIARMLAAGAVLAGACAPGGDAPAGGVAAQPGQVQFGEVTSAPIFFHRERVRLTNTTGQPQTVAKVTPSDGLRVELGSGRYLPAGGRGELIITLDARTRTGAFSGEVSVAWEDAALPPLVIPVVAFIRAGETVVTTGPNLEIVGSSDWNFGTVQRQSVYYHDFMIRNGGTEPLVLTGIATHCGCVQAWADDRTILPGATAAIHVRVTPAVYPGNEPRKTVTITSNDADTPVTTLMVYGSISDSITIEPSPVDFGEVAPGSTPSVKVVVRATVQNVPPARQVVGGGAVFSVERHPEEEGGNVVAVATIRIRPDAPLGPFEVLFGASFPRESGIATAHVPVRGSVGAALTVTPAAVNFGLVKPHEVYRRTLYVPDVPDSTTLHVESQVTNLTATVEPGDGVARVELLFAPLQGVGEVTGQVILTDAATGRARRVPVVLRFEQISVGR